MKRNGCGKRNGQSLVETALILPFILLVLTAIIDFGLLFNNCLMVSSASREGARKAVTGGSDSQIVDAVRNTVLALDYSRLTIVITPDEAAGRDTGDAVTVAVEYEYSMVTPVIAAIIREPLQLKTSTTMRCE